MDRETGYVDDELCWDCNMRPISTSQHLCDMFFAAWEWERMEKERTLCADCGNETATQGELCENCFEIQMGYGEPEDDDDGPWGGGFANNH